MLGHLVKLLERDGQGHWANWMQKALAPYTRHLTPEAMVAGTRLNILEGLRSGTTTFFWLVTTVAAGSPTD